MKIFQPAAVSVNKTDDLAAAEFIGLFELAAQIHPRRSALAADHAGGQLAAVRSGIPCFQDDAAARDVNDLVDGQPCPRCGKILQGGGQADIGLRQTDRYRLVGFIAVGAAQLLALPYHPQAA